jgi:hypothetical protein
MQQLSVEALRRKARQTCILCLRFRLGSVQTFHTSFSEQQCGEVVLQIISAPVGTLIFEAGRRQKEIDFRLVKDTLIRRNVY